MTSYDVYLQAAGAGDGADDVRLYTTGSIAVSVSETGTGSETVTIEPQIPIAESGAGADTPLIDSSFIFDDSGVGTDTPSVEADVTATDAGVGTEATPDIAVSLTVSETGSGSEAPSIAVTLTVTDIGSGTESSVGIQGLIGVAETGVGTQTSISITMAVTVSETSAGVDIPNIVASLTLTDSATGSESVAAGLWSTMSEVGVGVDALTLIEITSTSVDSGIGVEFAWRTKPTAPMLDTFELPHVLSIRAADEVVMGRKIVQTGILPDQSKVAGLGRTVEIQGWTDLQTDLDSMDAMVDGVRRIFYHPSGESYRVIVAGLDYDRNASGYDRRTYTLTLKETQ